MNLIDIYIKESFLTITFQINNFLYPKSLKCLKGTYFIELIKNGHWDLKQVLATYKFVSLDT